LKTIFKTVDLYIDLGTANTLIYAKRRGFLLNEPSFLAYRHDSPGPAELFGLGRPAKAMLGKNPPHLSVVKPLREGVIADFDGTARMLHAFLRRVRENIFWFRPRMIISLPCRVTPFERRAVEEVGLEMGAREVQLLDEPMAAAIGSGLQVLRNRGEMIVDIGGGTTEIAVISLGGIVASTAIRRGGDDIDEAIVQGLQKRHHFLVGEATAERIKIAVAHLNPSAGNFMEVGGIDLIKGLPGKLRVDSSMVFECVNSVVQDIIQGVRRTLELVPPEIAGDIAENGIVLAGGGALLGGLGAKLNQEIGVPVRLARDPLLAVAFGGAQVLEDDRLFDHVRRSS
jgi:rod shape-determining protein MreB